MKKTTTKATIAPPQAPIPAAVVTVSPPEQIDCRIWRAWKGIGYHERSVIDGLLLTEPNNLDAPIAYLKIGGELGLGSMEKALRRAAQIFQNTAAIDRDDTPMDLRTLCRWWSTEATPAWLYDIQVMPAEGVLSRVMKFPITLCPLCPVRMGVMVEQYINQRFQQPDREAYPFNAIAMFSERNDDDGTGMGDTEDATIWRGCDPQQIPAAHRDAIREARKTVQLVPPVLCAVRQ